MIWSGVPSLSRYPSLTTFNPQIRRGLLPSRLHYRSAQTPSKAKENLRSENTMLTRVVRRQRSFARASLASVARGKFEKREVGMFGICEDRNSSFLRGPAQAPAIIRKALRCPSSNSCGELEGFEVVERVKDYDDIYPSTPNSEETVALLRPLLRQIVLQDDRFPIMLGGDHSVTYPMVKVMAELLGEQITIVHFDAHPDIYPTFEDNPWSHASPFARIMEGKSFCSRLISCGIRTGSSEQRAQLDRFPVTWIEAKNFPEKGNGLRTMLSGLVKENSLVYVTVDLDVLEPGLAPGVSHREAGGLTVRQLVDAVHSLPGRIVGGDVVEYNPLQDVGGMTAYVASKVVKELATRILAPDLCARLS